MKTKETKKPNRLEKLVLNCTAPFKMNQEFTTDQISVLVGGNDTGKSFMLKLAFALGAVGMSPVAPPGPTSSAQFVFNNTFVDQKFDGLFEAVYTNGRVSVEIKEGVVTNADVKGKAVQTIFMSTDMRTFDQMSLYVKIRNTAGNDPLSFMQKMLNAYRLYDVDYMEALLTKLPFRLPEKISEGLKVFDFKEGITSIELDQDIGDFYVVFSDGGKKNIATYGKGHQAILNMMIGSFLG